MLMITFVLVRPSISVPLEKIKSFNPDPFIRYCSQIGFIESNYLENMRKGSPTFVGAVGMRVGKIQTKEQFLDIISVCAVKVIVFMFLPIHISHVSVPVLEQVSRKMCASISPN